jgi:predicted lactoylglutathione lyase
MATNIFINLPVKDLQASIAFFTKLGYTFNPQFTDENATCMIISDTIYAMLITHKRFKDFTKKAIADATKTTEVLIALSAESKEKVQEWADKAIVAGGKEANEPQDHGFMISRSVEDLDGHIWEIVWMDPNFVQK